jgi:hydrogenase/urease accessory protein HupE
VTLPQVVGAPVVWLYRGLLVASLMATWAAVGQGVAHADVFRPAYLELRELGDGRYDVFWKVPAQDAATRLALDVIFPAGTEVLVAPRAVYTGNAIVERWQVRRPSGLVDQSIRIAGRAQGVTDVIARVQRIDGSSQVERLPADRPVFTVAAPSGTLEIAWSYLVLGIEHILAGFDHLLFVLALLLIVRGTRRIVATVTSFTAAHSLTLGAAALGWVHVPVAPVEAIIALSIAFVAAEIVHGELGRPGLTARAPWVVAFAFGLLHGLGFASALAEVGLPERAIPVALLMFNVGVEIGQLLFVAASLCVIAYLRRLELPRTWWSRYAVPYAIGAVAMFWVVQRVSAF